MGVIRLLLALAVVGAHCNSHPLLKFVGGEGAVQAFFVISGFYMAMIIGSYKSIKDFWISRYLRLYPVYMVCALVTFVLVQGRGYIDGLENLPLSAILLLTFANVTMFFQDVIMFLGVNNEALSFVGHYGGSGTLLYKWLVIPPGWSLGLELFFYVLVPFLLKKSIRLILFFLLMSGCIRILLIGYGYVGDPWSYRFFPSELSIFLLGSLAYKIYESNRVLMEKSVFHGAGFVFIMLFLVLFVYLPVGYQTKKMAFIISLTFFIGGIFSITKDSRLDGFAGALSYPIYISHLLVMGYFLPKLNLPSPDGKIFTTLVAYVVVIGFSIALYFVVEKPIDLFRRGFKMQAALP